MMTPFGSPVGLTPEQQDILNSPYSMMSPSQTTYDPLRMTAYTGGSMGYMPQAQFLTPHSYGAFRSMPSPYAQQMANMEPSFWHNLLVVNDGLGLLSTYNPAVNQQVYRTQASRRVRDDMAAVGANVADLAFQGMAGYVTAGLLGGGPLGALAGLAVGAVVPSIATPFTDRIRETRAIQQSTMGKIVGGADVDLATGMGFSTAAAAGIDRFIRKEAAGDFIFKEDDYRNLLDLGLQAGMFDFSNSAQQYKDKIKQLRKTMTSVMDIVGSTDFKDILKQFKRLQDMGASSTQFSGIMRLENAFARMTGLSHEDMVNTYGQQGAVIYSQVGLDGYAGSLRNMANAAGISLAQRQGLISEATLARHGGVSGLSQKMTEGLARVEHNIQDILLTNMMNDDMTGLDMNRAQNFLDNLADGKVNTSNMYGRTRAVFRNTATMMNYEMFKGGAYSKLNKELGAGGMENMIIAIAQSIGASIDKNTSVINQIQIGLRTTGMDAKSAQMFMINHFNPERQANLAREKDLERAQRAEEYREQHRGIRGFTRGISEWWADVKDSVFGSIAGRLLKDDKSSNANLSSTPFLSHRFGQSSLNMPAKSDGKYSKYRGDVYEGGSGVRSNIDPTSDKDNVYNRFWDENSTLTYDEFLEVSYLSRLKESDGATDLRVGRGFWSEGYKNKPNRDEFKNKQFHRPYGPIQLYGRFSLYDAFYDGMRKRAKGGSAAAKVIMQELFDNNYKLDKEEVHNMSLEDKFANTWNRLQGDDGRPEVKREMYDNYAASARKNATAFAKLKEVKTHRAIQAMLRNKLQSQFLFAIVNHLGPGAKGSIAGAYTAIDRALREMGLTEDRLTTMSDGDFLNLEDEFHARTMVKSDGSKQDRAFNLNKLNDGFAKRVTPKMRAKFDPEGKKISKEEYEKKVAAEQEKRMAETEKFNKEHIQGALAVLRKNDPIEIGARIYGYGTLTEYNAATLGQSIVSGTHIPEAKNMQGLYKVLRDNGIGEAKARTVFKSMKFDAEHAENFDELFDDLNTTDKFNITDSATKNKLKQDLAQYKDTILYEMYSLQDDKSDYKSKFKEWADNTVIDYNTRQKKRAGSRNASSEEKVQYVIEEYAGGTSEDKTALYKYVMDPNNKLGSYDRSLNMIGLQLAMRKGISKEKFQVDNYGTVRSDLDELIRGAFGKDLTDKQVTQIFESIIKQGDGAQLSKLNLRGINNTPNQEALAKLEGLIKDLEGVDWATGFMDSTEEILGAYKDATNFIKASGDSQRTDAFLSYAYALKQQGYDLDISGNTNIFSKEELTKISEFLKNKGGKQPNLQIAKLSEQTKAMLDAQDGDIGKALVDNLGIATSATPGGALTMKGMEGVEQFGAMMMSVREASKGPEELFKTGAESLKTGADTLNEAANRLLQLSGKTPAATKISEVPEEPNSSKQQTPPSGKK